VKQADFKKSRERMVSEQIYRRGISDKEILDVFKTVPRHCFVPEAQISSAYGDYPLPIGCGQTISQPYIVALMTKELEISPGMKVLEVGTGSGYQTAILSALGARVYSLERIPELADRAKELLSSLGFEATIKVGDGTLGWPEHAPYERIIVTAAAGSMPKPLIDQLAIGGRLVLPLGGGFSQELTVLNKVSEEQIREERICSCVFVPLIGRYGFKE